MRSESEHRDEFDLAVRAGVCLTRGVPESEALSGRTRLYRIRARTADLVRRQIVGARSLILCATSSTKQRATVDPPGLAPAQASAHSPTGIDEVVATTPYGGLLLPAEDTQLVAAMQGGDGVLEAGTTRLLTQWLNPGDTMIDVGANIGLLSIPAAGCVGAQGQVVAFEPLPRLADILRRNVERHHFANRVTIIQAACGPQPGSATLNVGKVLGHSSLLALTTSVRTEQVPVVRLDDAVMPGQRVALVKLDAEGFELQVWRGMQRVVADNPDIALIVEFGPNHLARAGVSVAEWFATFASAGFACYEIDERSGRPMALRETGLEDVESINMLFVRDKRRLHELFGEP